MTVFSVWLGTSKVVSYHPLDRWDDSPVSLISVFFLSFRIHFLRKHDETGGGYRTSAPAWMGNEARAVELNLAA